MKTGQSTGLLYDHTRTGLFIFMTRYISKYLIWFGLIDRENIVLSETDLPEVISGPILTDITTRIGSANLQEDERCI